MAGAPAARYRARYMESDADVGRIATPLRPARRKAQTRTQDRARQKCFRLSMIVSTMRTALGDA
jgi:hypothetical protein